MMPKHLRWNKYTLCPVWREIMSGVTWDYFQCAVRLCPVWREIMSRVPWDYARCDVRLCPVWREIMPDVTWDYARVVKHFLELELLSLNICLFLLCVMCIVVINLRKNEYTFIVTNIVFLSNYWKMDILNFLLCTMYNNNNLFRKELSTRHKL